MSATDQASSLDVARYRLDERLGVVLVLLVILLLMSGWITYAVYTDPTIETEERTLGTYDPEVQYEHSATAPENNPLYPGGTVLENQPGYYFNVTPEIEGEYVYEYETSESTAVELDTELELVVRSYQPPEDDEDPEITYWQLDESLAEDTVQQEGTEGQQTVSFDLDIRQLENRLWQIDEDVRTPPDRPEDDYGTLPGTDQLLVVANTTVTTEIAGEPIESSELNTLTMDPVSGMIEMGIETESDTIEVDETTTSTEEPGILDGVFVPMIFVVALGSILILGAGRLNGTLAPPAERMRGYEQRRVRERFDDWISTGTLPEKQRQRESVTVSSLEDLVDTAMDTNSRVIEDEVTNRYYVVDEAIRYEYVPPTQAQADETES